MEYYKFYKMNNAVNSKDLEKFDFENQRIGVIVQIIDVQQKNYKKFVQKY